MKRIILFTVVAGLLAACSKDKFQTVPQVKITSFGPEFVTKGSVFSLVAEITDKEGDLMDSLTLVRKRFTGTLQVPPTASDTTRLRIADYGNPTANTIELKINFGYGQQIQNTQLYNIQESQERGLVYQVIVSDKAKNKSTPVESNRITLQKY